MALGALATSQTNRSKRMRPIERSTQAGLAGQRMNDEPGLIPEALMVRVADRLRVLGQPARLGLVEQLTRATSTPQELSDSLGRSQQNVSKHLLSLYRAGILSRRPDGVNVFYALADDTAAAVLRQTLESVTRQLRELSELASAPDEKGDPGVALDRPMSSLDALDSRPEG